MKLILTAIFAFLLISAKSQSNFVISHDKEKYPLLLKNDTLFIYDFNAVKVIKIGNTIYEFTTPKIVEKIENRNRILDFYPVPNNGPVISPTRLYWDSIISSNKSENYLNSTYNIHLNRKY